MSLQRTEKETFEAMKEDRLERLVRGGLLKRGNAREVLSDMAMTIREGLRQVSKE